MTKTLHNVARVARARVARAPSPAALLATQRKSPRTERGLSESFRTLAYFTLAKMITRVYSANDSISARPRISDNWMPGRAAGLRARPSAAAAVALACPRPHTAEAMAIAKPEVIATQLVPAGAAPWAKTGTARHMKASAMKTRLRVLRIGVSPCCRLPSGGG